MEAREAAFDKERATTMVCAWFQMFGSRQYQSSDHSHYDRAIGIVIINSTVVS